MRGLVRKTILAAAIAGSGIFVAMGAQAHDDDHWRDERWRREHRHQVEEHERWRHEPPRLARRSDEAGPPGSRRFRHHSCTIVPASKSP